MSDFSPRTRAMFAELLAEWGGEQVVPITAAPSYVEDKERQVTERFIPGGVFLLDGGTDELPLWGTPDEALWMPGEELMICGPPGVGKSTLGQRIVCALLGIGDATVLGLPVAASDGKVLYLALDRRRQIVRSFRRMVTDADRDVLDRRLVFADHFPHDLLHEPGRLLAEALDAEAQWLVIDSLKDLGLLVEKPEHASAYNTARQEVLRAGVNVVALHHQKKSGADGRRPTTLADVYGGMQLTAGAGSVVLLWGKPEDLELRHLKSPMGEVGPLKMTVDLEVGEFTVRRRDVLAVLRASPRGLPVRTVAVVVEDTPDPDRSQIEKVRRELRRLENRKLAHYEPGTGTGVAGRAEGLWFAVEKGRAE